MNQDYKRYIEGPRWAAVRQLYWRTYGKVCQACGSRKNLKVHHKSYEHFGREPMRDLAGVCQKCHLEIHRLHRIDKKKSLRLITDSYIVSKRSIR